MSEDQKQPTEEELKIEREQAAKELEEKVNKLMVDKTPLELYKLAYEEGWDLGFDCGLDAQIENMFEHAEALGSLYEHALADIIDSMHEDVCESCKAKQEEEEKEGGN